MDCVNDLALKKIFEEARTPQKWTNRSIEDDLLIQLYELTKLGPTSGNCQPGRFAFLRETASKEKLKPALSLGNVQSVLSAPVVVIVAHDPLFYEFLDKLNPSLELKSWYAEDMPFAEETAIRNSTLQGGFFILAARALGLDVWPMSGFDNAMVNAVFFEKEGWQSNFLMCVGYACKEVTQPRLPRLEFNEACLML